MPTSNGVDNQSNKTFTYAVAGIIVVAIAAWAIYGYNHPGDEQQPAAQDNSTNDNTSANTSTPAATGGSARLSYGDAIKVYPYRFQFLNCHGNPGMISVRKGSVVMLDNRDGVARTIKANGQSFKIAAYDYALVSPAIVTKDNTDLTLSNVTCDGGGAATLNVEK